MWGGNQIEGHHCCQDLAQQNFVAPSPQIVAGGAIAAEFPKGLCKGQGGHTCISPAVSAGNLSADPDRGRNRQGAGV